MRSLIALVDKNWGIGRDDKQLIFIKEDLARFYKITKNKTLICGRKTLEALPNGKPLADRRMIVLTSQMDYHNDNVIVYHDLNTLLEHYPDNGIVIGGASVYNQLYMCCDTAYITYVNQDAASNKFIHRFDYDNRWRLLDNDGPHTTRGKRNQTVTYYFQVYDRRRAYNE